MPQLFSQSSDTTTLRDQIKHLAQILNRRDLDQLRAQMSPARIYVEMLQRTGSFLSANQTLGLFETFFRGRTALNVTFDFVNDDGVSGSASGGIATRTNGTIITYRLNCGFIRSLGGKWLLTRITLH